MKLYSCRRGGAEFGGVQIMDNNNNLLVAKNCMQKLKKLKAFHINIVFL